MHTPSVFRRATTRTATWWTFAFTAAAGACASRGPAGERPPRDDPRVITRADLQRTSTASVLDAVSTLRPQWLQPRGTDTLGEPGEIRVYIAGTRASGGLSALRDMPITGVSRIEFVDPIAAAARWGLDHGRGAIVVSISGR